MSHGTRASAGSVPMSANGTRRATARGRRRARKRRGEPNRRTTRRERQVGGVRETESVSGSPCAPCPRRARPTAGLTGSGMRCRRCLIARVEVTRRRLLGALARASRRSTRWRRACHRPDRTGGRACAPSRARERENCCQLFSDQPPPFAAADVSAAPRTASRGPSRSAVASCRLCSRQTGSLPPCPPLCAPARGPRSRPRRPQFSAGRLAQLLPQVSKFGQHRPPVASRSALSSGVRPPILPWTHPVRGLVRGEPRAGQEARRASCDREAPAVIRETRARARRVSSPRVSGRSTHAQEGSRSPERE